MNFPLRNSIAPDFSRFAPAVCILFAIVSVASAVERPVGFVGIPWGASPEEAKRILQKRTGVKFPEESDDYHIELTGGTFAGQPVAKWVIEFPDRKFASAAVTLKPEGSASSVYKEFRSQLSAKYGSPTSDKKLTLGKGGASAIYNPSKPASFGNATAWRFPTTMKEKMVVVVSAELAGPGGKAVADETQLSVTIKYVNETLTGAAAAAAANPPTSAKPAPAPVKKDDL